MTLQWTIHIYNEITIYIYKEIFPSGARLPPDPTEGVPPLCTPSRGRVYILLWCKYFMGYKHSWKQGPLYQEYNQAPQPTISQLETNLNNSTLLYMLDSEPSWTWKISHLHLHSWRPTETEQELSFSLVTLFVNMSAGFWLVCIFSIFNFPSSKVDHMKWYLNCICLVFKWKC